MGEIVGNKDMSLLKFVFLHAWFSLDLIMLITYKILLNNLLYAWMFKFVLQQQTSQIKCQKSCGSFFLNRMEVSFNHNGSYAVHYSAAKLELISGN